MYKRQEYAQLKELLTPEEYAAARGSTLNAHYTSPTVILAIYEAVGRMGFETGNILEPSCGCLLYTSPKAEHKKAAPTKSADREI